jgi:plasmid maintenance system antidote protein VapI
MNLMDRLTPITPGEFLDKEFLQPLGVSQYRLAKAIDVPAATIRIYASAVFWD